MRTKYQSVGKLKSTKPKGRRREKLCKKSTKKLAPRGPTRYSFRNKQIKGGRKTKRSFWSKLLGRGS